MLIPCTISVILSLFAVLWICYCDCYTDEDTEINSSGFALIFDSDFVERSILVSAERINRAIEKIEKLSPVADKSYLSIEETVRFYDEINANYEDIIEEILENPNTAYKFLQAQGLDRVIITNLGTAYTPLRSNILFLLKTLLDLAPYMAHAVMPATMIDKMQDIFVNDDDLSIKAHVFDILLHIWLPENPKVQAKLMKMKGLVPFDDQMAKFDNQEPHTLLDLFNKILQEYFIVRYKKTRRCKRDTDELKLYTRIKIIGLPDHMSRKDICNGLLEVFSSTWLSSESETDVIVPILDLSTKVTPFCLNSFKNKVMAKELFDAFLKYLKEQNRNEYFVKFHMNATNMETVITNYVDSLTKGIKYEF